MRTGERLNGGRPGRASCTLPRQPGLQCTRLILGGLQSVNTVLCGEEHIPTAWLTSLQATSLSSASVCHLCHPFNRFLLSSSFFQALYIQWDTGSPYHNSEKMSYKHINKKIPGTNLCNNWIRGKGDDSVIRALTAHAEGLSLAPSTHMTTCS